MKRLITGFVIATPFVGFVSCFAAPTTLYVDEGAIIFCRNENRADVLSDVSFFDIEVAREVKTRALKLEYPILDPDEVSPLYARRFPRAWHVEKGVLSILFPDFLASAIGDIYIKLATVRNVSGFCAESANWNSTGLDYRVSTEGTGCLASIPFAVPLARRHGFAELMAPWYALGEKSLVSRLPYDGKGLQWSPLCAETCYGWGEFVLGVNVSQSCQSVAERQTSCDSYNPVAGVWVLGKNVVSDNPRFVLPSGADWLIWECGEKTSRICKMKEGRWSVVTNASCEDVPSLIVVNNDENSVFLSFSFKFDENDMSASMRGVTAYLMEHDVLHRDKLKSAVRNSGAELSAFEKSCVEDEIEQARIIDESRRALAKERARIEKGHEAIHYGEEAVRLATDEDACPRGGSVEGKLESLGLTFVDGDAKRGALLYEKMETRAEGVALLRKEAKAGNPFALARLSALYYLGEGGVVRDYEMSLKLMEKAVGKGFPSSLLPMAEARARAERARNVRTRVSEKLFCRPGDGFKGSLRPYVASDRLKALLDKYHLVAGWFVRDDSAVEYVNREDRRFLSSNKIPYLLFKPEVQQRLVPMLIYFGGLGERGTDLEKQFGQTTIFEKITSKEFQRKYPCYLFAPMVQRESYMRCQMGAAPPDADLVCDAMYALIRENSAPSIDTNRLYLTGLSVGGSSAYTFPFGYPGRFAAALPVAGYASAASVCNENPGHIWLLCNESECASEGMRKTLAEMGKAVRERGGEFRLSTFPSAGHNAWDNAWREDVVWDWMFSKSVNGKAVSRVQTLGKNSIVKGVPILVADSKCTATKPGKDATMGPSKALDGLDATCYVSAEPFKKGDFWSVEFTRPVKGRITVKTGYRDGRSRVTSAHVETSSKGRSWSRHGSFSRDDGEFHLVLNSSIRHLRIVSDSRQGEAFVLREICVFE